MRHNRQIGYKNRCEEKKVPPEAYTNTPKAPLLFYLCGSHHFLNCIYYRS